MGTPEVMADMVLTATSLTEIWVGADIMGGAVDMAGTVEAMAGEVGMGITDTNLSTICTLMR